MSAKFNIALCGLPSAGKSTIINSLCGKRFAQSGARRTTVSVQKFGPDDDCDQKIDLVSDDGFPFNIIDLPGMCDVEDKTREFEKFTYDNACKADIVFWVTDVSHAFMTTHEREEFNKLMVHLDKKSLENGRAYQYGIIISKCDLVVSPKKVGGEGTSGECAKSGKNEDGEITGDEDTTTSDIIDNVQETFPNIDIVYYNAYGRIKYHQNSSLGLKLLINLGLDIRPYNISFDLNVFKSKQYQCEQRSMFRHLIDTLIKPTLNAGRSNGNETSPCCGHNQGWGGCQYGCGRCGHGQNPSICQQCSEFFNKGFDAINSKISLLNDPQVVRGFYDFLMVKDQQELSAWLTKYNLSHQTYKQYAWNSMSMSINFAGFNTFEIKKAQESLFTNAEVVFRGMQLIGPSELSSVRAMMKFFGQPSINYQPQTISIWRSSLLLHWNAIATHLPSQNDITFRFNNKKLLGCSQKFVNELSELRMQLWEHKEIDVSYPQLIAMYGSGAINGGLLIEINM
jgi:GTP-binding protein EngB required for normal cell division